MANYYCFIMYKLPQMYAISLKLKSVLKVEMLISRFSGVVLTYATWHQPHPAFQCITFMESQKNQNMHHCAYKHIFKLEFVFMNVPIISAN